MRRLRKLHRCLAERLRQGAHPQDVLTGCDHNRWNNALRDRIVTDNQCLPTLAECLRIIDAAITKEASKAATLSQKQWSQKFRSWTTDIWKPATAALKPPVSVPQFTAEDMSEDWRHVWSPHNYDEEHHTTGWLSYADQTRPTAFAPTDTNTPPPFLPTEITFCNALLDAHGSAGFDGWTSHETRAIAEFFAPPCH